MLNIKKATIKMIVAKKGWVELFVSYQYPNN